MALVLFAGILSAPAQKSGQQRVDSLLKEISAGKYDSVQVKVLLDLSQTYSTLDPKEGIRYGSEAIKLAEKAGWKNGVAKAYYSRGLNHLYLSDFENAEKDFSLALKLGQELKDSFIIGTVYNYMGVMHDYRSEFYEAQKLYAKALELFISLGEKRSLAATLGNMGISKMCVGENDEALLYLNRCLALDQELRDTAGMTMVYINLGVLYYYLADFPTSLEHYFKALKFQEETGDERGAAITSGNIGGVYLELGDYDKALHYSLRALRIYMKLGDRFGEAGCLSDIGEIYAARGNHDKAMEYMQQALAINIETQNRNYITINYANMADIYYQQKQYTKAVDAGKKALETARQIGGSPSQGLSHLSLGQAYLGAALDTVGAHLDSLCGGNTRQALQLAGLYADSAVTAFLQTGEIERLKDSYLILSEAQEKQGNFGDALMNYKNYVLYKDSIYNTDNERKIARLEEQRTEELNRKQLEIRDLKIEKVRNERWYFVAGLILLAGLLATVFNRYRLKKKANIIISREKKRSDDLLLNILPSEVAEELKDKGYADARHFDEVSVLFTDFKNFSGISERLSPAELVAEIDVCFKAFDHIMEKYRIEKIKTIGDSYMAAGGLPVANATPPSNVVMAALEMQAFMLEHAEKRRGEGKEVFEIRLGIHTGPVVAGIVGIKKFAYDIWGDTVNIASRMESSGETGKVNISGSTWEKVRDQFHCTHRGKIEAKNKGMIDMYFVDGIISNAE